MTKQVGRSNFFYGYVIVIAACWIMAVSWGTNRTFGVFLSPLSQEFGWTRAGISGAFTVCMIVLGTISLAVGRLTDRIGPRSLIVACSLFMGGGFLLCSRVGSLWDLYLFFGVFTGIGMSGAFVPMMSMVARWFVRRRSLMSGILSAGPAAGIVLMPLLVTWLIARFGWRTSFVLIGILTFLGLSAAAFFLKRDPGQIGAMPFGIEKVSGTYADMQNHGMSLPEAIRTRSFWLLNLISLLDNLLMNIVIVHIVPYVITLHIDPFQAATVLSIAAGVSIPARIGMGWLADRIGNRRVLFVCLNMAILAFVILFFARGMMALYFFAVVYGIGLWSSAPLLSTFVADLFGLKAHGAIFSCTYFFGTIGGGLGPVLVGYLFDLTGSYQQGLLLCLGASLMSLIAMLCVVSPTIGSNPVSARS